MCIISFDDSMDFERRKKNTATTKTPAIFYDLSEIKTHRVMKMTRKEISLCYKCLSALLCVNKHEHAAVNYYIHESWPLT